MASAPRAGPPSGRAIRDEVLTRLHDSLPGLRDAYGVRELAVFGSVARGDARPGSDVDVLVDFRERASFDAFMGLREELERLLGRRVDLVTRKALRPRLEALVELEAVSVA